MEQKDFYKNEAFRIYYRAYFSNSIGVYPNWTPGKFRYVYVNVLWFSHVSKQNKRFSLLLVKFVYFLSFFRSDISVMYIFIRLREKCFICLFLNLMYTVHSTTRLSMKEPLLFILLGIEHITTFFNKQNMKNVKVDSSDKMFKNNLFLVCLFIFR